MDLQFKNIFFNKFNLTYNNLQVYLNKLTILPQWSVATSFRLVARVDTIVFFTKTVSSTESKIAINKRYPVLCLLNGTTCSFTTFKIV